MTDIISWWVLWIILIQPTMGHIVTDVIAVYTRHKLNMRVCIQKDAIYVPRAYMLKIQ